MPLALLCKQNSCNIHLHNNDYTPMWAINHALIVFCSLPRDATQSAVLLWQVVCPSVCP